MDPITGVMAGGMLLGQAGSYFGQRSANKTNLKLAKQAREHDVNMWNSQNAYNTPQMQMQRLKEAGLNPNLVAGQASQVGQASAPQKAPVPQVQNQASAMAQMDLTPMLSLHQDWQVKKQEISMMQEQQKNLAHERLFKTMQMGLIGAQTARSKWDLGLSESLKQYTMDGALADLRNQQAKFALDQQSLNHRAGLYQGQLSEQQMRLKQGAQGLSESGARIQNIYSQMQDRIHGQGMERSQDARSWLDSTSNRAGNRRKHQLMDYDIIHGDRLGQEGSRLQDNMFQKFLNPIAQEFKRPFKPHKKDWEQSKKSTKNYYK